MWSESDPNGEGDRGAILHLIKYIDVPYKSGLILKKCNFEKGERKKGR